jgi:hypothetical protein
MAKDTISMYSQFKKTIDDIARKLEVDEVKDKIDGFIDD